jgi:hypothetical protein
MYRSSLCLGRVCCVSQGLRSCLRAWLAPGIVAGLQIHMREEHVRTITYRDDLR